MFDYPESEDELHDFELDNDEIYAPWIDTWEIGSDDPPEWPKDENELY
jgi:hypothetical protein